MTDKDFLLHVLADGLPHSLNEILQRSFAERGCGLTVHSRAADLRRDGHTVANWKDGDRGNGSWYRLGCVETSGGSGDLLSPAGVSTEPPGATSGASPAFTLAGDAGSVLPDGQLVLVGAAFRKSEAA